MVDAALHGFLLGLSLILAIGAQNAFVLRQGLKREHVGAVVLACALSDAILIAAGVAGFGALSQAWPWLGDAMRYGGAAFLIAYGALRFKAAWRGGESLAAANAGPAPLTSVLATCLLLTWANPHVYLDTLVLVGSVAAQYAPDQTAFGIGAALASFVFFGSLGYGAHYLAPYFERPRSWQVLEFAIGCIMWAIALGLLVGS